VPIHDVGYRPWTGQRALPAGRVWVIAETGIRLAWKSQWLRRMLVVAWLPATYLGVALFAYEQMATGGGAQAAAPVILSQLPQAREIMPQILSRAPQARHDVWALVLLTLFRYPQGILMVLLIGLIAPPMIAGDMRSRAYLLYFSRPIERFDYVLGKSLVLWTYLFLITAIPALGLYVLGVSLSPDLSVVTYTWDLPLRILAASVWLVVPTAALAMCYSSLTSESRYAGVAWFATWTIGWVAYASLTLMDLNRQHVNGELLADRWALVSLYHSLGRIQTWVFGLEPDFGRVLPAIVLISLITAVSFAVLVRRVTAPLRI
jgi:ABC-type transport system involved in multi-copper enzyme maturation permease subunit